MIDKYLSAFFFLLLWMNGLMAKQIVPGSQVALTSPDKKLVFNFFQLEDSLHRRSFHYSVRFKEEMIITTSNMDLDLDNHLSESAMALKVDQHRKWFDNLLITRTDTSTHHSSWKPVYGEQNIIIDHYNTLRIEAVKDDNPIYKMDIEVRVYNEGVAFRYFFPENEKGTYYRIMAENDTFSLPPDTYAWVAKWAQAPYERLPLSNWKGEGERPLTLALKSGTYVSLVEGQMVDYSRTKFKLDEQKSNTIKTSMFTPVDLISPVATPWRLIMVAEDAARLAQNSNMILNLNEQPKQKDLSYIRPGKIMRVMSQTTKDALENIDFAVKRNLQYILFDWKWYGPAFDFKSDATKVAIKDFDLPAIIKYAKDRNIGVWLYVNQQALLLQSDSLFATYQKWGVSGVKFGFVQVGSHRWTTWIQKAIQQAAASKMMINVHDDWRQTGEQRTWPNLMTAEGIRGNEEMPSATSNTVMPFTRYLCGPADYTICYFDKRIKTTHAHQLALAAIYYSPIQTLYWYDRPSQYNNEPELEFWDKIPATWDETRVLQGTPGEFISTARRAGTDWFMGTITNDKSRKVKIKFDFLPPGASYEAKIYSDDDSVTSKTKVGIKTITVNSKTEFNILLNNAGGQAIWLRKI